MLPPKRPTKKKFVFPNADKMRPIGILPEPSGGRVVNLSLMKSVAGKKKSMIIVPASRAVSKAASRPVPPKPPPAPPRPKPRVPMDVPPNLPFLRFEEIVGRGGMAVVWRAHHLNLDRTVAVKVMNADFTASGKDVRQFMMEVRAMTDLHHPGLVQGYGADVCDDGRYYFLMDYVGGYTFNSLLRRKIAIPETDAVIVCESVAEAMSYAWNQARIVHCDLKPENIMVDTDGTVKIMDLGLCRVTNTVKSAVQSEEVVGTPAYISPEQIYGDVELDCRADIYSMGATLYHFATGSMVFPNSLSNDAILRAHVDPASSAPDPRELNPAVSDGFARMITRMLVKERDDRYADWLAVYEDAVRVERGEEIAPPNPNAPSSVRYRAE